jgi:acyl-CoA hydrolase
MIISVERNLQGGKVMQKVDGVGAVAAIIVLFA